MKRLVVTGGRAEDEAEVCPEATSSEEISIVTVSSDDIVTLATSVVAQLTGEAAHLMLGRRKCQSSGLSSVSNAA